MLPGTVALVCAALWPTPNPATASITAAAWKGFICMTGLPGKCGPAGSRLSATRSTLDAGSGAARRSDNSTKQQDGTDIAGSYRLRIGPSRLIICASFQPLPNTEPGLAGETGVSRN
jgi:hypothetical protein